MPITNIIDCEQRAKSIVTIRGTRSLTIQDETFNNNYIVDDFNPRITAVSQAAESLKSNALLIIDATGDVRMTGVEFNNNIGFRGSLTITTGVLSTIGFKSTLILLERTSF